MNEIFKTALLAALMFTPVSLVNHLQNGDDSWIAWAVLLLIDIIYYIIKVEIK